MDACDSLSPFSRSVIVPHVGAAAARKLARVKIGIAGAGGLGSNAALLLVRSGIMNVVIADPDVVAPSNLNRQAFMPDDVGTFKVTAVRKRLQAINPDAVIQAHPVQLDAGTVMRLFHTCDAVIEAFDDPAAKGMLVQTLVPAGVTVVAASGIGGWGDSDAICTRQLGDNLIVVGDAVSACTADCPPMAPRVMVTAAKQADVVLAQVLGERGGF
ncbi:MAG: thiamine biosynthesis protein ThiF [Deltaproteobacteria bacterium]|nr:MAG: thiamine biosynthesis protein ThiF [Deltaproteobacteria bacterium]